MLSLTGIEQGADGTTTCATQLLERSQGRVLCAASRRANVGWLMPSRRPISVAGAPLFVVDAEGSPPAAPRGPRRKFLGEWLFICAYSSEHAEGPNCLSGRV